MYFTVAARLSKMVQNEIQTVIKKVTPQQFVRRMLLAAMEKQRYMTK